MKFDLLKFQKTAVDELTGTFLNLWKTQQSQIPLTFKSPTGSGKTLMTVNFINNLHNTANWNCDIAFIWITTAVPRKHIDVL